MNALQMDLEIRRRILALAAQDRTGIDSLGRRIEEIMSSTRLTPEAASSDAAALLAGGEGPRIRTLLSEHARRILRGGYAVVDADLDRITGATDQAVAAAREELAGGLRAASQNPFLLLNLYEKRHRDNAARRVLEGEASVLIDTLGDSDNFAFREAWNARVQDLAAARSPEEMEANSVRSELDELGEFLEAAETVTAIDLALMNPAASEATSSDERERLQISRSFAEAVVNAYHNKYPSGLAA